MRCSNIETRVSVDTYYLHFYIYTETVLVLELENLHIFLKTELIWSKRNKLKQSSVLLIQITHKINKICSFIHNT